MIKKASWYKKLVLLLCLTTATGMGGASLVHADTTAGSVKIVAAADKKDSKDKTTSAADSTAKEVNTTQSASGAEESSKDTSTTDTSKQNSSADNTPAADGNKVSSDSSDGTKAGDTAIDSANPNGATKDSTNSSTKPMDTNVETPSSPIPSLTEAASTEIVSVSQPIGSTGEMVTFTKQQAMDKAVETNNNIKKVDFGLNTIQRKVDEARDLSSQIKQQMDALSDFQKLYNRYQEYFKTPEYKKQAKYDAKVQAYAAVEATLSEEEKAKWQAEIKALELTDAEKTSLANANLNPKDLYKLKIYQVKFQSATPPTFSSAQLYNLEYNQKVLWQKAETTLSQTLNKKQVVINTIKNGMNKLFDGVLQMQDGYNVQSKLYEEQKKEYEQTALKAQLGVVSELDRKKAEMDLKKMELQTEELRRKLENLQIQLRQLIGIPLTQPMTVKGSLDGKKELGEFDAYLKNATTKRTEITDAQSNQSLQQVVIDIMDKYYNKDEDTVYKDALLTMEEYENDEEDGVRVVSQDIRSAYLDVKKKEAAIDLAAKNLEKANTQLEAIKVAYDVGVQPINMKWKAELGKVKAEMDYRKAVLDYNNQLSALEKASDIGPSYNTKGATK